jgi:hypothetical protein
MKRESNSVNKGRNQLVIKPAIKSKKNLIANVLPPSNRAWLRLGLGLFSNSLSDRKVSFHGS